MKSFWVQLIAVGLFSAWMIPALWTLCWEQVRIPAGKGPKILEWARKQGTIYEGLAGVAWIAAWPIFFRLTRKMCPESVYSDSQVH